MIKGSSSPHQGMLPEFRRYDYNLAMREPPPLMSIQPSLVSPVRRRHQQSDEDPMQGGPTTTTQALPLIKVKKKHDLYGKHWKPSADWPPSQSDLKEEDNMQDSGESCAAAAAVSSDVATTLFPVGRQVKFRIFDWGAARAAAAEEEEPVKPAFFPRWPPPPLSVGPLAAPRRETAPVLAASPPRLFPTGYAPVKHEPEIDYCGPAGGEEEAADAGSAVDFTGSCHHPEIWRQLRLHQFKMEVLDRANNSYHQHNNSSELLLLPPSLTSSGNSDSASSSSSSRSNSCLLPAMEEEEVEEGGSDQPLDFSLPALGGPTSPAKESAGLSGGPVRNYSVIMSPWKK
jgi:hypothetical protein